MSTKSAWEKSVFIELKLLGDGIYSNHILARRRGARVQAAGATESRPWGASRRDPDILPGAFADRLTDAAAVIRRRYPARRSDLRRACSRAAETLVQRQSRWRCL